MRGDDIITVALTLLLAVGFLAMVLAPMGGAPRSRRASLRLLAGSGLVGAVCLLVLEVDPEASVVHVFAASMATTAALSGWLVYVYVTLKGVYGMDGAQRLHELRATRVQLTFTFACSALLTIATVTAGEVRNEMRWRAWYALLHTVLVGATTVRLVATYGRFISAVGAHERRFSTTGVRRDPAHADALQGALRKLRVVRGLTVCGALGLGVSWTWTFARDYDNREPESTTEFTRSRIWIAIFFLSLLAYLGLSALRAQRRGVAPTSSDASGGADLNNKASSSSHSDAARAEKTPRAAKGVRCSRVVPTMELPRLARLGEPALTGIVVAPASSPIQPC
jgi:hypothetical protein